MAPTLRNALLCAAAATLALGASASTPHELAHASGAPDHVLAGEVVSKVAPGTAIANSAPGLVLNVGVALTPAPDEDAAAEAVNDPRSAAYHHYFTPASWAARFALPQSTYSPVVQRLTAGGLTVVYSAPTHDFFELRGTVAQVDSAFAVTERDYLAPTGVIFRGNAQAPTVPAAVDAVTGLTSLAPHRDSQGDCAAGVCVGALQYSDLWSIYDVGTAHTGNGQKIAIIGDGDVDQPAADLRQYEAENQLPQVLTILHQTDDSNCYPQNTRNATLCYTAAEGEWAMDSESSTSMAPNVSELDYYFGQTLGDSSPLSGWVNDPTGPLQASYSVGGCESAEWAIGTVATDDPIFAQAAAEGRSQFVSTGDTGGSCTVVTGNGIVNTLAPQVEYPSSDRWVVAVGGTVLYTDGAGHRGQGPNGPEELAWSHTGGGSSITQPEQPWQSSIGVIAGRCGFNQGNPDTATPPDLCRGTPDVAAMSGDITVNAGLEGFRDVEGGSDFVDGGTSLSSPLWAGMWARMQSGSTGGGFGFAAAALYAVGLNGGTDPNDFYDVTQGDNGQFPAIARNATLDPSGWDYVSGLGTPDVANLIGDLNAHPPGASSPAIAVGSTPTATVAAAASMAAVALAARAVRDWLVGVLANRPAG